MDIVFSFFIATVFSLFVVVTALGVANVENKRTIEIISFLSFAVSFALSMWFQLDQLLLSFI